MSEKTAAGRSILINGALLPDGLDERMIRDVVHGFYGAIGSDELLGPIFNGAIAPDAWPAHLAKMCDFWSSILLKTSRYEGRPLPPHLRIAGLGEEHFRRWLTLFRATVQRICPPQARGTFHGTCSPDRTQLPAGRRLQFGRKHARNRADLRARPARRVNFDLGQSLLSRPSASRKSRCGSVTVTF